MLPVSIEHNSARRSSPLLAWLGKPLFWFVVALIIRLLYLLEQAGSSPLFYYPMLDEKEAVESALQIIHGSTPAEPYFKAPAYSWLLALVISVSGDAWPWMIRLLQHLAGATLVCAICGLAGRLTSVVKYRALAVDIAGFFAALYAPIIRLEGNISLDFWATFLQSLMLVYLAGGVSNRGVNARSIFIAGILLAVSWLTRPTVTLVVPFLAAWIFAVTKQHSTATGRTFKAVMIFIFPVMVCAVGVTLRNQVVSHQPLLMPWQGGYSLYYANAPQGNGRYYLQSNNVNADVANPTRFLSVQGYQDSLSETERLAFEKQPDYKAVDKFWFNKTVQSLRTQPGDFIGLIGKKYLYVLSDKEIFNYEDFDLQRSLSPILQLAFVRFGIIFPLALAGLAFVFNLNRQRRNSYLLLWIYSVTLAGAIALYYTSGRMRMPIAPPLVALAGAGIAGFMSASIRQRVVALALLVLAIGIAWADWFGVRSESMAHADLARMSNAAWHRQKYEQALEFALKSERLSPANPLLPRLKGQAYYSLGQLPQAAAEFEKSVRLLNDDTSRRNLEVVREELRVKTPAQN